MNLAYKWKVLIVVVAGTFMALLDLTAVNVALPQIMNSFGAGIGEIQLVLSGYMIALGLIIPLTGFLSDRMGIKRVFVLSLAGFVLGSALCGLSWNTGSLVAFRIVQALAGGMLLPLAMTLVFTTVPREEQGFVMGILGMSLVLAPSIGPTLGGWLVENQSWRFIFYINVPVGVLAILLAAVLLRETEKKPTLPFDTWGFLLASIGFGGVLLALSRGVDWGWRSATTLSLLTVSLSALALWVGVEWWGRSPLMDLKIFTYPAYSISTGINFVLTVGMFSGMFLVPLFLQNIRGIGAFQTGLILLPQALAMGAIMPLAGRLYDRVGCRPLAIAGILLMAYGTFRLYYLDINTPDSSLQFNLVLRGVGIGLAMMPVMTAGLAVIPPGVVSRASAMTNITREIFAAFGVAVFATFLQSRQSLHFSGMAQTVNLSSLPTLGQLSFLQQMLLQQGIPLTEAQRLATLLLQRLVQLRAAVAAFDDAFLLGAMVLVLGLVPALLLRPSPVRQAPRGPRVEG